MPKVSISQTSRRSDDKIHGDENTTQPMALMPAQQFHPAHSRPLKSPARQFFITWLLTAFSSVWISFTVFFAYNCSLRSPASQRLLLSTPARTINALNVLSHITIFLLQLVVSEAFEAVRWALAGSPPGVSSFTFFILSRATSPFGILYLLPKTHRNHKSVLTGHRLWGSQRFHTLPSR